MLVKTIIDTRRANRFNKYPIKIQLSETGNRKYISLGIYAHISEFDEAYGLFTTSDKKTSRENTQHNNLIVAILTQINDLIMECRKKHEPITPETIVALHKKLNSTPKQETHTFNSYFKKSIESRSGRTKEIYQATLNKITEYSPQTLHFDNINKQWLKHFISNMKSEKIRRNNSVQTGLSINTQSLHLRNIRAVFNEAIDDQVVSLSLYPFRKFKLETEQVKHRAINIHQLRTLFAYKGTPSENWARDVAKLMFFLIGINATDLYNLTHTQNGYTHYRRSKTSRLYTLRIESEAKELMDQFKGVDHLLCFQEQFGTPRNFLKKLNGQTIFNKKGEKVTLKKGLNTIGEAIGLQNLTSYVLRHTWATIAAQLEIPKETIAKALGHGKKVVTDIYIDFDQAKIDQANRDVIDCVLGKSTKPI